MFIIKKNFIFYSLIGLIFIKCNSKSIDNTESKNFVRKEKEIEKDTTTTRDSSKNNQQAEKEIFENLEKEYAVSNQTLTFSHILDSLNVKDKKQRIYYFLQITKTIPKAEGAYSEALGYHALSYINKNINEFINLKIENKITNSEFNNWITLLGNELELQKDISNPGIIKNFVKFLENEKKKGNEKGIQVISQIESLIKKRFD